VEQGLFGNDIGLSTHRPGLVGGIVSEASWIAHLDASLNASGRCLNI
jgi:hypothetical protein